MGLVKNIKIKRLIQIYKTWQTHKYKQHLNIRKKIPWKGLKIYNSEEQFKKWHMYIYIYIYIYIYTYICMTANGIPTHVLMNHLKSCIHVKIYTHDGYQFKDNIKQKSFKI
jgi:hypothetical protein